MNEFLMLSSLCSLWLIAVNTLTASAGMENGLPMPVHGVDRHSKE
jgi:hypothetical protein